MMYYFLIASLPTLEIGTAAEFSTAEFDEMMQEYLGAKELEILCSCSGGKNFPDTCRVYREMARFEEYLRTRIAQKRADRAGIQFSGRDPEEYYSEVDHGLMQAASCSNPLEREYMIDRLRWARLDELALEHDFDFDAMCIYRTKLVIVNKYADFRTETGTLNFTAALDKIISSSGKSIKES